MARRVTVFRLAAFLLMALAAAGCGDPPPPRRVFLITIDTLRADHLGLYGYRRPTSPFLDSLGERSLVFDHAFASSSHTAPSHASLFTALHPAQHRVLRNGEALSDAVITLARIYRELGYRTAAFSTVSFLRGLRAGFDEFSSERRFHPAAEILAKALAWVRGQDAGDRLFVWIHLYDVHQWSKESQVDRAALKTLKETSGELRGEQLLDYLRREHGTEFEPGRGKVLSAVNRYDAQILSVDRALADFFAAVEAEGLGREALWAVTSDHGEGLGNHDYMGHGKTLYAEQIRVPLLLHFSDGRYPPRRVGGLVQLVDLGATLAELAGASFDGQVIPAAGRSLRPLLADPGRVWDAQTVYAERRPADEQRLAEGWPPGDVVALRTARYKLIVYSEGDDEIYDLEGDPFELRNLIDDPPPEKDRLLEGLLRRHRAMKEEGERLGTGEINPEYIEELKALGYL
jgi:arylsulfatase A-like enzyme